MSIVLHWLLFGLGSVTIIAASERLARRATTAGDLRVLATGSLAAAIAVSETLLLGTIGLGGNAYVLTAAAVASWLVTIATVPATGVSSSALSRAGWQRLTTSGRTLCGSAVAVVVTETAYLVGRPAVGTDGLIYHLGDPAIWIADGHPGSMHVTVTGLAVEAYPKTGEVLFSWAAGTARTPIATTLVLVMAATLAGIAAWSLLRRLEVTAWVAVSLAIGLVTAPIMLSQLVGPNTDMLTVTWMLCAAAMCLGVAESPRLLPIALVAGGVAVGTKSTAIPIMVVLLAVTGWRHRRALSRQPIAMTLAGAVTVGIGAIWYVQDLVTYHAPLYPFSRFPAGPTLPPVVTVLGARFISHPIATARITGIDGYWRALGAGLVFALVIVAAIVLLPTVRERRVRSSIAIACLAAVAETAIWSAGPFTGAPGEPGNRVLALGGLRYLLPGVVLFMIGCGLASRARGPLGLIAKVGVIGALVLNVWTDRQYQLGVRPPLPDLIAATVIGALAAGFGSRLTSSEAPPALESAVVRRGIAAALAVAAVTGLVAGTHGYLDRHIAVARQLHIDEPDVLAALEQQPRWQDGHLPVATGPVADALLAGPTFSHQLQVIGQNWSCAEVRGAAAAGWVILPSRAVAPEVTGQATYDPIRCLAGVPPLFIRDGLSVFAPRPVT